MVILKTLAPVTGLFGPVSMFTSDLAMPDMGTCKAYLQTLARDDYTENGFTVTWNSDATAVSAKYSNWPYKASFNRTCVEFK